MAKNRHETRKRKSIISFDNLSEELKELFKEEYPTEDGGYKPYLQKTIKPNGEPIFSVPLETEDAIYMVKFEVKIDTPLVEEDLDKELFSEKGDDESELDVIERDESGETDTAHKEFTLKHGSYEDDFMAGGNMPNIEDELAEEFDTGEEEDEEDDDLPPEDDDMMDFEPDDDELMDIENELLGDEILTEKSKKKPSKAKETKKSKETKSKVAKEAKPSKATKTLKEPKVKASKESKPKAAKEAKTVKEPKAAKAPAAKVKVAKEPKTVKEPKKTKKETSKK